MTWDDCEMTWDHLIDFGMTWLIFDWLWDGFGTYDFGMTFDWLWVGFWMNYEFALGSLDWLWVCEKEHFKKSNWTLGGFFTLISKVQ